MFSSLFYKLKMNFLKVIQLMLDCSLEIQIFLLWSHILWKIPISYNPYAQDYLSNEIYLFTYTFRGTDQ